MACPFGTGWIQETIKEKTDEATTKKVGNYKDWFMPKMQEDMQMVLQRESRAKLRVNVGRIEVEERKEDPKNMDIINGCFISDISKFASLEHTRFEKFVDDRKIRDFEKEFPYYKCNKIVGVPLKHYVQNKCTYNDHNLMAEIWENNEIEDVVYDPSVAEDLPGYFANYEQEMTSPEEFEQIPLKQTYKVSYAKRPKNPGVLEPKEMFFDETITIYWISPRKVIRHTIVQGSGFTFAANFHHEACDLLT